MTTKADDHIVTVVTCEGDLKDPTFPGQLQGLVAGLKRILCTENQSFRVTKLEPWNSVRVTFQIPREAAQRLRQLAQQGDRVLRELGILSVQIEGDQVISLTIAGRYNEPQEILLRTESDGRANSGTPSLDLSGSEGSPGPSNVETTRKNIAQYLSQQGTTTAIATVAVAAGSSAVASVSSAESFLGGTDTSSNQFKSPNVVAPGGEPIPFPRHAATPSRTPGSFGPFPFASMTHAAMNMHGSHHQTSPVVQQPPGATSTASSGASPSTVMTNAQSPSPAPSPVGVTPPRFPFSSPPPPYPGNASSLNQLHHSQQQASAVIGIPAAGHQPATGSYGQPPTSATPGATLNNLTRGGANVALSSPLLVNLLQSDMTAGGVVPSPTQAMNKLFQTPHQQDGVHAKRKRKPRRPKDRPGDPPLLPPSSPASSSSPLMSPLSPTTLSSSATSTTPGTPMATDLQAYCSSSQPPPFSIAPPIMPSMPLSPPPTSVAATSQPTTNNTHDDSGAASQEKELSPWPSPSKRTQHLINPFTGQLEPMPSDDEEEEELNLCLASEDNSLSNTVDELKDVEAMSSARLTSSPELTKDVGKVVIPVVPTKGETSPTIGAKDASPSSVSSIGSPGEKIKLRLKLDPKLKETKEKEPVAVGRGSGLYVEKQKAEMGLTAAGTVQYKVDVSFVNIPTVKKASASSSSTAIAGLQNTGGSNVSSTLASSMEPRVPPLHISLRGRNAMVVGSLRKEEKGGAQPLHPKDATTDNDATPTTPRTDPTLPTSALPVNKNPRSRSPRNLRQAADAVVNRRASLKSEGGRRSRGSPATSTAIAAAALAVSATSEPSLSPTAMEVVTSPEPATEIAAQPSTLSEGDAESSSVVADQLPLREKALLSGGGIVQGSSGQHPPEVASPGVASKLVPSTDNEEDHSSKAVPLSDTKASPEPCRTVELTENVTRDEPVCDRDNAESAATNGAAEPTLTGSVVEKLEDNRTSPVPMTVSVVEEDTALVRGATIVEHRRVVTAEIVSSDVSNSSLPTGPSSAIENVFSECVTSRSSPGDNRVASDTEDATLPSTSVSATAVVMAGDASPKDDSVLVTKNAETPVSTLEEPSRAATMDISKPAPITCQSGVPYAAQVSFLRVPCNSGGCDSATDAVAAAQPPPPSEQSVVPTTADIVATKTICKVDEKARQSNSSTVEPTSEEATVPTAADKATTKSGVCAASIGGSEVPAALQESISVSDSSELESSRAAVADQRNSPTVDPVERRRRRVSGEAINMPTSLGEVELVPVHSPDATVVDKNGTAEELLDRTSADVEVDVVPPTDVTKVDLTERSERTTTVGCNAEVSVSGGFMVASSESTVCKQRTLVMDGAVVTTAVNHHNSDNDDEEPSPVLAVAKVGETCKLENELDSQSLLDTSSGAVGVVNENSWHGELALPEKVLPSSGDSNTNTVHSVTAKASIVDDGVGDGVAAAPLASIISVSKVIEVPSLQVEPTSMAKVVANIVTPTSVVTSVAVPSLIPSHGDPVRIRQLHTLNDEDDTAFSLSNRGGSSIGSGSVHVPTAPAVVHCNSTLRTLSASKAAVACNFVVPATTTYRNHMTTETVVNLSALGKTDSHHSAAACSGGVEPHDRYHPVSSLRDDRGVGVTKDSSSSSGSSPNEDSGIDSMDALSEKQSESEMESTRREECQVNTTDGGSAVTTTMNAVIDLASVQQHLNAVASAVPPHLPSQIGGGGDDGEALYEAAEEVDSTTHELTENVIISVQLEDGEDGEHLYLMEAGSDACIDEAVGIARGEGSTMHIYVAADADDASRAEQLISSLQGVEGPVTAVVLAEEPFLEGGSAEELFYQPAEDDDDDDANVVLAAETGDEDVADGEKPAEEVDLDEQPCDLTTERNPPTSEDRPPKAATPSEEEQEPTPALPSSTRTTVITIGGQTWEPSLSQDHPQSSSATGELSPPGSSTDERTTTVVTPVALPPDTVMVPIENPPVASLAVGHVQAVAGNDASTVNRAHLPLAADSIQTDAADLSITTDKMSILSNSVTSTLNATAVTTGLIRYPFETQHLSFPSSLSVTPVVTTTQIATDSISNNSTSIYTTSMSTMVASSPPPTVSVPIKLVTLPTIMTSSLRTVEATGSSGNQVECQPRSAFSSFVPVSSPSSLSLSSLRTLTPQPPPAVSSMQCFVSKVSSPHGSGAVSMTTSAVAASPVIPVSTVVVKSVVVTNTSASIKTVQPQLGTLSVTSGEVMTSWPESLVAPAPVTVNRVHPSLVGSRTSPSTEVDSTTSYTSVKSIQLPLVHPSNAVNLLANQEPVKTSLETVTTTSMPVTTTAGTSLFTTSSSVATCQSHYATAATTLSQLAYSAASFPVAKTNATYVMTNSCSSVMSIATRNLIPSSLPNATSSSFDDLYVPIPTTVKVPEPRVALSSNAYSPPSDDQLTPPLSAHGGGESTYKYCCNDDGILESSVATGDHNYVYRLSRSDDMEPINLSMENHHETDSSREASDTVLSLDEIGAEPREYDDDEGATKDGDEKGAVALTNHESSSADQTTEAVKTELLAPEARIDGDNNQLRTENEMSEQLGNVLDVPKHVSSALLIEIPNATEPEERRWRRNTRSNTRNAVSPSCKVETPSPQENHIDKIQDELPNDNNFEGSNAVHINQQQPAVTNLINSIGSTVSSRSYRRRREDSGSDVEKRRDEGSNYGDDSHPKCATTTDSNSTPSSFYSKPVKRRCSENAAELIKACMGLEDPPKRAAITKHRSSSTDDSSTPPEKGRHYDNRDRGGRTDEVHQDGNKAGNRYSKARRDESRRVRASQVSLGASGESSDDELTLSELANKSRSIKSSRRTPTPVADEKQRPTKQQRHKGLDDDLLTAAGRAADRLPTMTNSRVNSRTNNRDEPVKSIVGRGYRESARRDLRRGANIPTPCSGTHNMSALLQEEVISREDKSSQHLATRGSRTSERSRRSPSRARDKSSPPRGGHSRGRGRDHDRASPTQDEEMTTPSTPTSASATTTPPTLTNKRKTRSSGTSEYYDSLPQKRRRYSRDHR